MKSTTVKAAFGLAVAMGFLFGLRDAGAIPVCGDGRHVPGVEECEDGNTIDGDGCSSTCTIEKETPECGNGVPEAGEECDDGNTTDGDGCSSTCTIETTPPACGNWIVESGEDCDDGNTTSGDGCTSDCSWEYMLVGEPTYVAVYNLSQEAPSMVFEPVYEAVYQLAPTENEEATPGYIAVTEVAQRLGEPSVSHSGLKYLAANDLIVLAYCGDGVHQPYLGEQCDDGNKIDFDGCNSDCRLSPRVKLPPIDYSDTDIH